MWPGFDQEHFPYLLVKEQDSLSIFDPFKNHMSQILKHYSGPKGTLTDTTIYEEDIIFQKDSQNCLFTIKRDAMDNGQNYLVKYAVNMQLIESLKEQHQI